MTPSAFQSAIYSAVTNLPNSLCIEAVAGSGKSTTLVEIASLLDCDYRFLAFNKAIAEALKARGVDKASTFHSLLLSEITSRVSPRPTVDARKVSKIFKLATNDEEHDAYYDVIKLVSLAKNSGFTNEEDNTAWEYLIDEFDLEFPDNTHAIALASRILRQSTAQLTSIDFDDMLYIPYIKEWSLKQYPVILIDEAQDTNGLQLSLLLRLVAPGGRVIAVGDQAQAIYGFRGAGFGSMDLIRNAFSAHQYPLSISYRCSQSVVTCAQEYVPAIQAAPNAVEGLVAAAPDFQLRHIAPGSAILCRVNRPLVAMAYRLIREGISVQMLGRDLGAGLARILAKHKAKPFCKLAEILVAERETAIAKAAKKSRAKAISTEDTYNSLLTIIESLPPDSTHATLAATIDRIFAVNPAATVTLCTVHRSKGLEWRTVYILDKHLYMPHPRAAEEGWEQQQERNLIYVAVTRAKENLFFISSKESTNAA